METIRISVHHFVTAITVILTITALILSSLAVSGHIDYRDDSIPGKAINNHSDLFVEHGTGNTSAVIDAVLEDGELGAQIELNASVAGDNTLSLGGIAVTASAAEINRLSGVNKHGNGFHAGGSGVILEDADGSNYLILDSPASITSNYTLTFPSTVAAGYLKADAAGVLSFADASENPKLHNVQNGDAATAITLTNNAAMTFGTTVGKLQLKASTDVELNADSGIIKLIDNVTTFGALTNTGNELVIKSGIGSTTAMTFSGADVTHSGSVTVGVNDTGYDVKFFGATSGAYMLWDESDDDLKLVGGAGLVQSGAGANTLTGATTFSNTVTVGVNDTGYDVKFFGATSGAYMLWDESDDDLKLVGGAGLVQSGAGANTLTGTTTFSNTVTVGVDGTGYDVRFYGNTAGAYMGWDQSLDDLMLVGAAGLNQSGTGNVAFGGPTTFSNTVTVGVNDTGYDVKFFGATSGAYMLWDESDDQLKLVNAAGSTGEPLLYIDNNDTGNALKIDSGSTTGSTVHITSNTLSTGSGIHFECSNTSYDTRNFINLVSAIDTVTATGTLTTTYPAHIASNGVHEGWIKMAWTNTLTGAAHTSSVRLPEGNTFITQVMVIVTVTTAAGQTADFGLAGDPNGILATVSLNAVGLQSDYTDTIRGDYAANSGDNVQVFWNIPDSITGTNRNLVLTLSADGTAGHILIKYVNIVA